MTVITILDGECRYSSAEPNLFLVDDIVWPNGSRQLPCEAEIELPSSLVLADHIDDEEWDEAITGALTAKFGVRPVEFGGFETAD